MVSASSLPFLNKHSCRYLWLNEARYEHMTYKLIMRGALIRGHLQIPMSMVSARSATSQGASSISS